VIVEIGLCTGLLLLSQYFTDKFFGLTRAEQEAILARSQELTERRKQAAAAEEQLAAEAEQATAEAATVQVLLDQTELRLRLPNVRRLPRAERLTPALFLQQLPVKKRCQLRDEILAGKVSSVEAKAYLALSRRKEKGGRHDA
jgi:hypothetical protein